MAQRITTTRVIANGESTTWDKWKIDAIPRYNIARKRPETGGPLHTKGRDDGFVMTYGGKRFYLSGGTEGIPETRALKNIEFAFVWIRSADDVAG